MRDDLSVCAGVDQFLVDCCVCVQRAGCALCSWFWWRVPGGRSRCAGGREVRWPRGSLDLASVGGDAVWWRAGGRGVLWTWSPLWAMPSGDSGLSVGSRVLPLDGRCLGMGGASDGRCRTFGAYGVVYRWIVGVEVSWCVVLSHSTGLYVVIDVSWSLGVPMVLGSNKSHMSIFFTQYKVQFQSRMSLGVSGPQSPCCVFFFARSVVCRLLQYCARKRPMFTVFFR